MKHIPAQSGACRYQFDRIHINSKPSRASSTWECPRNTNLAALYTRPACCSSNAARITSGRCQQLTQVAWSLHLTLSAPEQGSLWGSREKKAHYCQHSSSDSFVSYLFCLLVNTYFAPCNCLSKRYGADGPQFHHFSTPTAITSRQQFDNMGPPSDSSSITVAVRVRPFTIREAAQITKCEDGPLFLGDGSLAGAPTPKLNQKGLRSIVKVIDDRCL